MTRALSWGFLVLLGTSFGLALGGAPSAATSVIGAALLVGVFALLLGEK